MQYTNLYAGPVHSMEFKYATILNTVFITFFYGTALPLLYPIAAFTFWNLYVVDRIMVTYFYQEPPNYAEKLNKLALRWLKASPFFLCLFGWWCLGQPEIFNN
jgi:hypothetical protein